MNKQVFMVFTFVLFMMNPIGAFAEDTIQTQSKNLGEDAKTHVKKSVRKTKKLVRKATGTDNALKDAKDTLGDAKDDVNNSANKLKNKVQE